jgi:hypothetical protein
MPTPIEPSVECCLLVNAVYFDSSRIVVSSFYILGTCQSLSNRYFVVVRRVSHWDHYIHDVLELLIPPLVDMRSSEMLGSIF